LELVEEIRYHSITVLAATGAPTARLTATYTVQCCCLLYHTQ